ncbi:MAG: hypothetical protein R3E12_10425 [Candidatus Eisenbacteria bacterium]
MLEAVRRLLEAGLDVVLAPRHLRELDHWRAACAARGLTLVARSERPGSIADLAQAGWAETTSHRESRVGPASGGVRSALLVDRHGELRGWYECARFIRRGDVGPDRGAQPFRAGLDRLPRGVRTPRRDGAGHGGGSVRARWMYGDPGCVRSGDWVWKLRSDPEVEARWRAGALEAARSVAGGGDRLIDYLTERGLDLR